MLWGEPVFDHRAVLAAQVHCLSNIDALSSRDEDTIVEAGDLNAISMPM